jgi:serine phosphatase RsbU (regulator of sigma subunit)
MFVFVLFYSIFSLLVILFNLPTTSVFEQKFEEVISFQRLAEALQQEEKEEKVYEILLDTALETIDAESAWIEIKHNTKMELAFTVERNLKKEDVKKMINMILQERKKRVLENTFQKKMNRPEEYILANYGYQSVLSVPLMVNENSIGNLMLLKKEKDAFDEEKRQLIHTFARQASISIENFRLLTRTIEAERYKEDLKIAQIVQEKLLPTDFALSDKYDISAFSKPAYEVGGDYYDVYSFKDKIIIIIGDVSGKGTKAAFHMAQMKGIFQTLAQMELHSKDFFKYANNALSRCLSKDTFITATLVSIDAKTDEIEIARAGHCPTLYCAKDAQKCVYLKAGGMGLGILRNQQYANSIQNENLYCNVDDILLLYTDGLVEARNALGDEFGEERLAEILLANKHCSPTEINKKIKESLKDFRHETPIFDDYTAVVIKRKN